MAYMAYHQMERLQQKQPFLRFVSVLLAHIISLNAASFRVAHLACSDKKAMPRSTPSRDEQMSTAICLDLHLLTQSTCTNFSSHNRSVFTAWQSCRSPFNSVHRPTHPPALMCTRSTDSKEWEGRHCALQVELN